MATAVDVQPNGAAPGGVAAISRAVVAAAADLVVSVERAVIGESKIRTARSNAWEAIQADRARARARQEMDQLVRALVANGSGAPVNAAAGNAAPSRDSRTPGNSAAAAGTAPGRDSAAAASTGPSRAPAAAASTTPSRDSRTKTLAAASN